MVGVSHKRMDDMDSCSSCFKRLKIKRAISSAVVLKGTPKVLSLTFPIEWQFGFLAHWFDHKIRRDPSDLK